MSFGWAPSERLFSRIGGQGLDFFSRLEADLRSKEATPEPRVLKQNNIPLLHDVIVRELNRTDVSTPLPSGNIDVLLRGDFDLLLSAREEVRRSLQTTTAARSKKRGRSKSVSPRSRGEPGYQIIFRRLILEAGSYRSEIITCRTPQQFYDNLKITFLDVRKTFSKKVVPTGLICSVFLLSWVDFLRADFHSFNHHIEGVINLLRTYHKSLGGKAIPPVISYVAQISCMTDACIGFFGDKQRFPSELIPQDYTYLESYLHPSEIPRAVSEFTRSEYLRTISNFRRWVTTQRTAAGFDDPFVEEAIVRQGDAITAEIVAWADRTIPQPIEAPATTRPSNVLAIKGNGDYTTSYFEPQISLCSVTDQFLGFPQLHFQDRNHNESTMNYLGLLLLISYSAYPHPGHLPFSRWEVAIKYCQCYAAYPDKDEMGLVNRIVHLFYARLAFDESFPSERAWCDFQWADVKASLQKGASDVLGCLTTFLEWDWGLA